MCTAICYRNNTSYFGRNLDLDRGYGERVVITPRNFEIKMRCAESVKSHYAMIGMACVVDDFPLYYEAMNECGLAGAALSFEGNAYYQGECREGRSCLCPFEVLPYLLATCETVEKAEKMLRNIDIIDENLSEALPNTPLHFLFADRDRCIVVEPMREGIRVFDNPLGVLTNNPPFEDQLFHLSTYRGLSPRAPVCRFSEKIKFEEYSRGMGTLFLPGDLTSPSRFVRCAFMNENATTPETEAGRVAQFFHILSSVEQIHGCVAVGDSFECTVYSSCMDLVRGLYYYKTYENFSITCLDMWKEDLDGDTPTHFALAKCDFSPSQNARRT